MTTFLDRIVSKALAGPDDRSATRPRFDRGTVMPAATLGVTMDADTGEDGPVSEMEQVSGQTDASQLTRSLVTSGIDRPEVFPRVDHTKPEHAPTDSRDVQPRTRPIPAEPTLPAAMPAGIRSEESLPWQRPAPPVVDVFRQSVRPPAPRHTTPERQASVAPGPPVPTSPGDRDAAPQSGGRTAFRDVPEPGQADVRGVDHLPSSERQERPRLVPRVAIDHDALHEVVVPVATPPRRSPGHSAQSRDANRDETTVHVTIGRLEIRAPQSVPAAAPRRTQPAREVHLEDYLKKRASRVSR